MTITRLQRVVVDALEDIKAQDIRIYDTSAMTELFDRVVIASATSNRQTRALASHVRDTAKAKGYDVISTEGEDTGEWVLVDLGDLVVHIMQPAIRQYYNLEELWGGKPVRMRIGAPPATRTGAKKLGGLRPASTGAAAPDTVAPGTATVKPAARSPAPARASTPAKSPARKAAAPRRRAVPRDA